MLLVEQERIIAINSIQWSQSFFGEPVLIINRETPRLSLQIHPSAACIHGEYGSVCFKWQTAILHFRLKSPRICSKELSTVIEGGTPSRWKSNERDSWASPFCSIGKSRNHPKEVVYTWAHLLPPAAAVWANIVSLNSGCRSRL